MPEQWPRVERLYRDSGFACPPDAVEVVHLVDLTQVPDPGEPPLPGMVLRRSVGTSGTRLAAWLDHACLGYVEVDLPSPAERQARHGAPTDDASSIAFVDRHGTEITRTRRGWTSVLG